MKTNEQLFDELVRQHKSTIYSVCYMFSDNQDEVADLFQVTLIHLWQGFDSFRGESKPETWIYRVAMNTCISCDRKKHRKHAELTMDTNFFLSTSDRDTQQIQQLYARIHRLSVVDRAIVMLWLENLSYDEIGAIIGISANNVSVKLVRIREQLKKN